MHVRGALRVACYHLLLLGVFGKHNNHHGTRNMSLHPSRLDRSHRHHLPTYMMHLYRHFKLNQTRPVENMEHEQADTIKSILSKSKIWHFYMFKKSLVLHLKTGTCAPRWKSVSGLLLGVSVAPGCQISAPDTFNPHLTRGWISPGLMLCAKLMWIRPSPDILTQISC